MSYTVGIVEHEDFALSILRRFIKKFAFLEIAWECSFPEEALGILEKKK